MRRVRLLNCALAMSMPLGPRGRVSPRCRAHEYCVGRLLGSGDLAIRAARSPARRRHRSCCDQRSRAVSPRTPPARSPSVDNEPAVCPVERARVIAQARAISKHWDSGVGGRAPCMVAASLGQPGSAACAADGARRRAVPAVAAATSHVSEEGMASDAAFRSGQLSASMMHTMTMAALAQPMQSSVGGERPPLACGQRRFNVNDRRSAASHCSPWRPCH